MDNAAIISGYSVWMPYAEDCSQLIDNLKQGKRVARTPWFTSNEEAIFSAIRQAVAFAKAGVIDEIAKNTEYMRLPAEGAAKTEE